MNHYPDGVSLSDYQRIGRMIRQYGTLKAIDIRRPGDPSLLTEDLEKAERKIRKESRP